MEDNVFDKGYELKYVGTGKAVLVKTGELPIVEFVKNGNTERKSRHSYFYTGKHTCWSLLPLTLSDEKIDADLPKNWRDMCLDGFHTMKDAHVWLESHGKYLQDYSATSKR